MPHTFHTLDVFTSEALAGNPLAVVLDADALDTPRMQAIAREFNLSETVFVLKPQNPAHTARVRIFTPAHELPFAGHPTVGTAVLLAELRTAALGPDHEALIVLEETIGAVRVGVRFRSGRSPFAEFDAPRLPVESRFEAAVDGLAAALGLIPGEIGFANHRPTEFSAGVDFAFVPVASLEVMAKVQVNGERLDAALSGQKAKSVFLYSRDTVQASSNFHARMFWPGAGVAEDPATGSAACAFAGVVAKFDTPPNGRHTRVIEQGFEMGRPSLMSLEFEIGNGAVANVRLGGHAVRVMDGQLRA